MDVNHSTYFKKTKFLLVFFCFSLLFNCKKSQNISDLKVNYENDKAVSVSFNSNESNNVSIHLEGNETAILGDFSTEENIQTFTPIIPFTNGKTYNVSINKEVVTSFNIENKTSEAPELIAIYPTTNEVPENLLKMYFKFSKPMQEVSKSLDYITVFNKTLNKEVDVFLELETELWNKNHTILTLWLDPGRIKTDLIPNQEKGLPIVEGNEYELKLSKAFRDANGNSLSKDYVKAFRVIKADKIQPSIEDWELSASQNNLSIKFNEPLDAILLEEVFRIRDSENNIINSTITTSNSEKQLNISYSKTLEKGNYTLQIETRLEDLAGNNLNRLFDEDLQAKKTIDTASIKEMKFAIK